MENKEIPLGTTKDKVLEILKEKGQKYRIKREDERRYIGTADFKPARVNLEFDNRLLTKISVG